MIRNCLILACLVAGFLGRKLPAGEIRINQVQVIGTHNSYHIAPDETMLRLIEEIRPRHAKAIDYTHKPLEEQFSRLGVRQVELDVFADPTGGLYAEPLGLRIARARGLAAGGPHDPHALLTQPGMKILHSQDIDFRTTVLTLVQALQQIQNWSHKHPRHFPITILIEVKQEPIGPTFTRPIPFDKMLFDELDREILSVFPREDILTPDAVRGSFATLPAAIQGRGWPTLEEARGKVLFALDNGPPLRDIYLDGHPILEGRVMFVDVAPDHPAAAWMKRNDAVEQFDEIQSLVRAGFLVRTRADAETKQARANDPTCRGKALASGAQFVSTDYPEPDTRFSEYHVRFADGVTVRTNPVNGDPHLSGRDLEELPGPGQTMP